MARRRYVSTNISVDSRVNRLATDYGDFAGLLYTWLIPHAGDDGTITSDPEEILFSVMPGRRDKTPEDIATAISGMVALGLLQADGAVLRFPPESFYRYQTYVNEARRTSAQVQTAPSSIERTPQNSEDQRASAQNAASSSSSFSVKSSFSGTRSAGGRAADADAPPPEQASQHEKPAAREKAPNKHPKDLRPLVDAFRVLELPDPKLIGNEIHAAQVLLRHFPPDDVAACWRDIAQGARGDQYDRDRLSFSYLSRDNRMGNWQIWRDAGRPREEQRTNGPTREHAGRPGEDPAGLDALAKY
jgi:hypothetical protein